MPANNPRPAPQIPVSPRNAANKYANKDGSKIITVPKGASESSQPSTPTVSKPNAPPSDVDPSSGPALPAVNRKKQKRRQKAAAKAAAEQAANGDATMLANPNGKPAGQSLSDLDDVPSDDEHEYILASELQQALPAANGHTTSSSKSKKKKKKKKASAADSTTATASGSPQTFTIEPMVPSNSGMSRDKIWSTSNQEERERIKEFWLGLGEDERKSLVKVEKDAVLKKMKEQQKHTCSCTVCGRKRTAIEEELEGLYDAYYVELEQFANQGEAPPLLPPSLRPPRAPSTGFAGPPPSRPRIVEHVGEEDDAEDLEEVYSDDEVEDDDYSDDEPPEDYHSSHDRDMADFLTFGNSLQVKGTQLLESLLNRYGNMDLGGILTVADDLLKNDGKRFIEMMEQLAERRMAREEDAREHFARGYGHPNGSFSNHSHAPPEDDDYDDEEDEDEEYEDSQDDEEYEDEEDPMTEEQRMEEGRRMFQIFAARMFEQRVLSAYKEKVAKERQQKLLEELEEESRQVDEQKARKAKNAQKKKDKAAQKKQALAEEKARKEAEKAAEEAARLEAEQKRIAEQKRKAEEKKRQKEALKKAEEEARLKKEAERQRKLNEQREKQAEQERKAREAKEREKKLKEEQRLREKEAREQREREAQERKDKQERDKREKEARAAKAAKEVQEAKEAKERLREEKAAQKAAEKAAAQAAQIQSSKRGQINPAPVPTALPPTVLPQHPPNSASFASPKIPVATPVIPKAPTPIRPRTTSQQHDASQSSSSSQPASAASQNPSPHAMTPVMSPGVIGQQRKSSTSTVATAPQPSHSASPQTGISKIPPPGMPFQIPPLGMPTPPGLQGIPHHPAPPGFGNRMPQEAMLPPHFRAGPNMTMPPPGINAPAGRGFSPLPMPPPGFAQPGIDQFGMGQGFPMPKDAPPPSHMRQGSSGFESVASQPIGRPAPIGRPGSVNQGQSFDDKDDETTHLGSRALLGDDEPLEADVNPAGMRIQPPGPGPRPVFGSPFMDSSFPMATHNVWGPVSGGNHAFPPPGFGNPGWGAPSAPPGFGMGSPIPSLASMRPPAQPRHVTVRLLLCQVCQELAHTGNPEGFIDMAAIKAHIEAQTGEVAAEQDLLNLCDTEGNPSNGGGSFDVRRDMGGPGKNFVRWTPDALDHFAAPYRPVGAPGEIGSPLIGNATVHGGL